MSVLGSSGFDMAGGREWWWSCERVGGVLYTLGGKVKLEAYIYNRMDEPSARPGGGEEPYEPAQGLLVH